MRIPLKQRVVHKVGQLFQTFPFLIHSQQINNTCSSFLLLVEHVQALMGEFCFASVLCCENIAVTVWRPAWRAMKPLHSVVPTDLLEVSIIKWIVKHIQYISWWQKTRARKVEHFEKFDSINAVLSWRPLPLKYEFILDTNLLVAFIQVGKAGLIGSLQRTI